MSLATQAVGPRIVVALDFPDPAAATALAGRLDPASCRLKVGKELFTRGGPQLVERLQELGFEIFLDLKFHDIPHTVAQACRAAADLGVWMVNVHALGGRAMLEAAREAVDTAQVRPLLIAVTVLTSHDAQSLREVGLSEAPEVLVGRLAGLAADCTLDGVVCSAREAPMLRTQRGDQFALVTPGIRPAGSDRDDQKRILTPTEAVRAGSDYLVIGRPITKAPDPRAALLAIADELRAIS